MPKRRRRQRDRDIEYYAPSDDEDDQLAQSSSSRILNHHTDYSIRDDRVSVRTSYIATEIPRTSTPPPSLLSLEEGIIDTDIPELEDTSIADFLRDEDTFMDINADYIHELADMDESQKRRCRTVADHPLNEWVPHRDAWLAEMLRHEGRCGYTAESCPRCHMGKAAIRCLDCDDLALYCETCTVEAHRLSPFHRIKEWVKTHFRRKTLRQAGLRIQLGHPVGERCTNPQPVRDDDFVILDISGIHSVGLDFCNCESALSHDVQLLRARLFPATSKSPKTAASFGLLEHFHALANQANVSGFHFYAMLERRTDNTGMNVPPGRYSAFMRMMRQWRHLMLMKRSGRGHDPAGISATTPGGCAVLCPACPHPGKNLPNDYQKVAPERRWLYRLFVGIDANFRLKRKKVSSDEADPGLNEGCAFFVEEKAYKNHINTFDAIIKEESSTCNDHDAIKLANMKGGQGTAASGVGTVECIRHDMKRPCSVGDLQKGERYVNMDYLFASSMAQNTPIAVDVSYDIACQWSVHLWERMLQHSPTFDRERREFRFLIPKFHLPAHQPKCHLNFSFNITKNVGRTDGEAPERGWAAVNPFASSTKEMGPGSRRDFLDDVFGAYNWSKTCKLAESLLTKVKNAVSERNEQKAAFEDLSSSLPVTRVAEWKEAIEAWENDKCSPNPFEVKKHKVTQASVRLQLAEEEAALLREGDAVKVHDNISPSMMIMSGLELEEQQRRLRHDVAQLGQHSTDLQRAKIIERRNTLQRRLDTWIEIQHLYMPAVAVLRSRSTSEDHAHAILKAPLYLPSETLSEFPVQDSVLIHYEFRLRHAQAHDALENLRRHLRLRSHLYSFKDRFIRGQRYNTWARAIVSTVQDKINADTIRYRHARAALETLAAATGDQTWQAELRPLESSDIRGMTEGLFGESEGRRTLSWIWRTSGVGQRDSTSEDEGIQEALRVEWCKARARAQRWTEECELLEEEMRRVVAFHQYYARWWMEQLGRKDGQTEEHREGLIAYALRQAELRTQMGQFCSNAWRHAGQWLKLGYQTSDTSVESTAV